MRQVITSFVDDLGEYMSPSLVVAPWRLGYNANPAQAGAGFSFIDQYQTLALSNWGASFF
jgi:hypothetical protein